MSNSYFQFKQFRVAQEHCAMKVSTDACIQGAWTPVGEPVQTILDIGAGTGLLSLMLAQRAAAATVHGVEADAGAAMQAIANAADSPFSERIQLWHDDARTFDRGMRYDMIVCNPPFFINSLQSPEARRNQARHTVSFTQEDMFHALERLLQPQGYASVLLPVREHDTWAQLLRRRGWSVNRVLKVRPFAAQEPNRIVSLCSRLETELLEDELVIYDSSKTYTEEFKRLMQAFYLYL